MKPSAAQNLLSACCGQQRVTIGLETPEELRRLSDMRLLSCPGCRAQVVLHAGAVRAHHFAHLPGAVCSLPQTEPETEEHRSGKILLARWLYDCLPDARITVEAWLPQTGQRADVLLELQETDGTQRRVALEFQCANLTEREWRRRHRLYRDYGIKDLWLLGGSRFHKEIAARPEQPALEGAPASPSLVTLRTSELERTLLRENAPLLFLDAAGEQLQAGTLVRFRPSKETQLLRPAGTLSARLLLKSEFPWPLLDWPQATGFANASASSVGASSSLVVSAACLASDSRLWMWLAQRYRVTPDTLSDFFGMPILGQEAFLCEARLWQAAVYYRFVHQNIGDGWWLPNVEAWSRAFLPLAQPEHLKKLQTALRGIQEAFGAAGLLSLPMGHKRVSARIMADLTTLKPLPRRDDILRLVRYRRTLLREEAAAYVPGSK